MGIERTREIEQDHQILQKRADQIEERRLEQTSSKDLVDLYLLGNRLKGTADDFRKEVRDELQERMKNRDKKRVTGDLGRVTRVDKEKRWVEDEDEAIDTMESSGVPRRRITSVDRKQLENQIESLDSVDKTDLIGSSEYSYLMTSDEDEIEMQQLESACDQFDDDEVKEACLNEFR